VLEIPVRIIEETIKKLANSGENKEKTDFMRRFDWFDNFTQSLKTKFNNCIVKKTFYPGAKIITEGTTNELKAFVIVEGTCNLVCRKANAKFTVLEYQNDPTKAKRDQEGLSSGNDNKKTKTSNTAVLQPLISNGYISKTLKTIQIGQKSTGEWLGEDLLLMETPAKCSFDYSAIAVTKIVTYEVNYADMFKIPLKARNHMINIAKTRRQIIV